MAPCRWCQAVSARRIRLGDADTGFSHSSGAPHASIDGAEVLRVTRHRVGGGLGLRAKRGAAGAAHRSGHPGRASSCRARPGSTTRSSAIQPIPPAPSSRCVRYAAPSSRPLRPTRTHHRLARLVPARSHDGARRRRTQDAGDRCDAAINRRPRAHNVAAHADRLGDSQRNPTPGARDRPLHVWRQCGDHQNRVLRLRSYTIDTLPMVRTAAGQMVYCSDLGGLLVSDGTAWRRVQPGQQSVSSDADFTLTPLTAAEQQRRTGTLTADRAVKLSTTNAYAGARFRVTRTGGGAFNLNLGTGPLKALATGIWAEFDYDGRPGYWPQRGRSSRGAVRRGTGRRPIATAAGCVRRSRGSGRSTAGNWPGAGLALGSRW